MTDEELEKIKHDEDKEMLSEMKNAKKEFELICKEKEGINCDICPLNVQKQSDLGKFELCLLWGLDDRIKDWKKYMAERYKKPTDFFRVKYMANDNRPFFIMYCMTSEKSSAGMKGWCKSILSAVKKCFENEVTNPFLISIEELATDFASQFAEEKSACYFVNLWKEEK